MLLDAVESVKKHSKLRSMYISLLKSMSGIMARISTDDAQPENAIVPWYESKGSVRAHHQVLGWSDARSQLQIGRRHFADNGRHGAYFIMYRS
jgi:hypothetical protein